VAERANDFIDGELGFWSAMQVRMHLLACGICSRAVKQMRTVIGLVEHYGDTPQADEPKQELLDAFRTKIDGASE